MDDPVGVDDGLRYAVALYDGSERVGFLDPYGKQARCSANADRFHSKSGVRRMAINHIFACAPLTVVPYDLAEDRPLDPLPLSENKTMPLKDEETKEPMSQTNPIVRPTDRGRCDRTVEPCHSELRALAALLVQAHSTLTKILDRLYPEDL